MLFLPDVAVTSTPHLAASQGWTPAQPSRSCEPPATSPTTARRAPPRPVAAATTGSCPGPVHRRLIRTCQTIQNRYNACKQTDVFAEQIGGNSGCMGVAQGTVLMALLQPAPETYDLFDDVLLLAEGQVIYHGPRGQVLPFFESFGFKLPERKVPPSHHSRHSCGGSPDPVQMVSLLSECPVLENWTGTRRMIYYSTLCTHASQSVQLHDWTLHSVCACASICSASGQQGDTAAGPPGAGRGRLSAGSHLRQGPAPVLCAPCPPPTSFSPPPPSPLPNSWSPEGRPCLSPPHAVPLCMPLACLLAQLWTGATVACTSDRAVISSGRRGIGPALQVHPGVAFCRGVPPIQRGQTAA